MREGVILDERRGKNKRFRKAVRNLSGIGGTQGAEKFRLREAAENGIIRRRNAAMTTEEEIETVRRALEDKKAEDVEAYDVRGRSSIVDATVAASATSAPHLRALAVAVERAMAAKGERARVSGDAESAWIVLDYADLMVHLFLPDARRYYDVESLWRKS